VISSEVVNQIVSDNPFKYLADYTCETYWAVI